MLFKLHEIWYVDSQENLKVLLLREERTGKKGNEWEMGRKREGDMGLGGRGRGRERREKGKGMRKNWNTALETKRGKRGGAR